MNPILYPAGESAFDTNGLGILSDAISCEVPQELNGQYELEMQYPVDGIHFSELALECCLLTKVDPVSDLQPFEIYRITKPMNGIVTVYARHIAYNQRGIVVSPFSAEGCPAALEAMKANATTDCPFTYWTDKTTSAKMSVKVPKAIWSLLGGSKGSILDVYSGEYEFDRYTVKLHNRRGADRGVSIRYGKNLTSLEQDANCANVYTGVYPYWTNADGALVELPEKILHAEGNYIKQRIMPLDLSEKFEEQPTEDELRTAAEQYMENNDIGTPTVSWKVEFVQLEQTEEYRGKALLERVLLGDTVSVEFPKMGVSASARAVAVRYDSIRERYKNITLGSVRANIADTIVKQQQAINRVQNPSYYQNAVDRATQWITNGKGYMVAVRDESGNWIELCSLDTQDVNSAVNVWRWNNGGLGFSSNGYSGPFKVAITQDGHIVADFITTGTLDASLLKTGVITSADGTVQIDLSNNKVIVQTLVDSRKGRIELTTDGIYGYGYNATTGEYYKTLRLDPGGKDSDSVEYLTMITSAGSTAGLSVAAGTKNAVSRFGQALSPTEILGSQIAIGGKTVSWSDNGDGTNNGDGTITVNQYSGSYPIIPGNYKWIIYGSK